MPGHLPYRGEVRPKLYGHVSPSNPRHHVIDVLLWIVFALVGIIIFCFAIDFAFVAKDKNLSGFFVFAIYLMFLTVAIFASHDSKQIKTITPDEPPETANKEDQRRLFEEYFTKIKWMDRHPNIGQPWLQSSYRLTKEKAPSKVKRGNRFIYGIYIILFTMVVISALFYRKFPELTIGLIAVTFLTYLANYLIRD